jgi:hypothetical protein
VESKSNTIFTQINKLTQLEERFKQLIKTNLIVAQTSNLLHTYYHIYFGTCLAGAAHCLSVIACCYCYRCVTCVVSQFYMCCKLGSKESFLRCLHVCVTHGNMGPNNFSPFPFTSFFFFNLIWVTSNKKDNPTSVHNTQIK